MNLRPEITSLKMILGEKADRVLVAVIGGGILNAVLVRPEVILDAQI